MTLGTTTGQATYEPEEQTLVARVELLESTVRELREQVNGLAEELEDTRQAISADISELRRWLGHPQPPVVPEGRAWQPIPYDEPEPGGAGEPSANEDTVEAI